MSPPPSLDEPDNDSRADLAAEPIQVFIDAGSGNLNDLATTCADLIADILHFAAREGHDTATILRQANDYFVSERLGENT